MKFKLDENLGRRTQGLFKAVEHDVHTVQDERLAGCSDESLFTVCIAERRCLVTLDLDFSDVLRFPPAGAAGIAIIRAPGNSSIGLLEKLVGQFLQALKNMKIENRLWIVEVGRIRIHQAEDEPDWTE